MVVRIELMSPSAEGNFDLRYVSIDDAQARKPKRAVRPKNMLDSSAKCGSH